MMAMASLAPDLAQQILAHLGVTAPATGSGGETTPLTLSFLDQLIAAYCRTVPWESAFRIARRAQVAETTHCPRWPEQFWRENLAQGAGGTCFESNYAFFALLQALGFTGYLTVNNMGETVGCHTAIVILLDGQKWLVDAGFPLYAALPISPVGVMHRTTLFLVYTVRPSGHNRYEVEQHPHPRHNAFTLVDEPVAEADYRAHTIADYGENGLFLDAVIINKIINDQPWRFNMRETPWQLHRFGWGADTVVALNGEAATTVARHFGLDEQVVKLAFRRCVAE